MTQLLTLLAGLSLAATSQQFEAEVTELKDAVASPATPDAQLYQGAMDLFDRMHESKIKVQVNLRGWDKEPEPKELPPDVQRLMTSARKRLSDLDTTVPDDLKGALNYAEGMANADKIRLDSRMEANQMGAYTWVKTELGDIKLNDWLAWIATKIGDALAFATVAHEAGHARDHQNGLLNGKDVIDGEVRAFKTQYFWLKAADPHGERVAWLRAALMREQQIKPNPLTFKALSYLEHLAKLHDTDGEERKIRELVHSLGYEDGHDHRDHDDPHSA